MKEEYDFGKMKFCKNFYVFKLKKFVIMCFSEDVVEYFKGMVEEIGVFY